MARFRGKIDKAWFRRGHARLRLSQNELAERLRMDRGALSRMLNGQRHLNPDEAKRVAEVFDTSLNEVWARMGYPHDVRDSQGKGLPELKGDLLNGGSHGELTGASQSEDRYSGLRERQAVFKGRRDMDTDDEEYIVPPKGEDPLFGCLAGTLTLLSDVDYTAPADPEWGRVYDA